MNTTEENNQLLRAADARVRVRSWCQLHGVDVPDEDLDLLMFLFTAPLPDAALVESWHREIPTTDAVWLANRDKYLTWLRTQANVGGTGFGEWEPCDIRLEPTNNAVYPWRVSIPKVTGQTWQIMFCKTAVVGDAYSLMTEITADGTRLYKLMNSTVKTGIFYGRRLK